jgi:hypothetical protein
MPSENPSLEERAVENRERIRALEAEVVRLRERQHEFSDTVAVVGYLADAVKSQGDRIEDLTRAISLSSQRALARPSASVVAQYLALVVAIAAIVFAASR